jgi:protein TonB
MGVTAMMIKAAGGPGLVSPIDFAERKPRLNRNTWIAMGVVAAAHIGLGVVIYHQRFELKVVDQPTPEARPFDVTMIDPPKVIEILPMEPTRAIPPNAPVNTTPTPMTPVDTITAVPGPTATDSTTITLATPVPIAVPDAAPVPVAPRPPSVITSPRWASQPSAAQMASAYPRRALENGTSGSASLNCLVSAAGTLSNCAITSQTPASAGFGRAADSLTRYFRMSPGMVDGRPIDGARVAFTVRFAVSD